MHATDMPGLDEADALLNGHPPGSEGNARERRAVEALLGLGREVGFGRLARLACELRELWICPGRVRVRARQRREALAALAEGE